MNVAASILMVNYSASTAEAATKNIVSVAGISPLGVEGLVPFGDLALPSSVMATFDDASVESVDLVWDPGVYDNTQPGSNVLFGTPVTIPGVTTNTGNVLASIDVVVGGEDIVETFTASGSWVSTIDGNVLVKCWGAAGSGGGRGTTNGASGGGGGGAYAEKSVAVTKDTSYAYLIGAGGPTTAAVTTPVDGSDGGNTSWNSNEVKAAGGKKGLGTTTAGAGGLVADSVGTTRFAGGNGAAGSGSGGGGGGGGAGTTGAGNNASVLTGGAAKTLGGGAGSTGAANASSAPGSVYGGASAGAGRTVSGTRNASNGAAGKIEINYVGVPPPPPILFNPNLILIAGQSNTGSVLAGDAPSDLVGDIPGANIYNFHVPAWEQYNLANNGRCFPGQAANGLYGVEARLMKLLQEHYLEDQYCIKFGLGGTGLYETGIDEDWSELSTGELFDDLVAHYLAAKAAIPGGDTRYPRAFIWIQGETDAGNATKTAAYETNLRNVIAAFRTDMSAAGMHFIIVRLGDLQTAIDPTRKATVRAAQATVAAETNNHLVDADGLEVYPDVDIHYDSPATDTLAERIKDVIVTIV